MCSRDVPPVDSKVCGGGVVQVQVVADYCATVCTFFSMQGYSFVQKVNYKYYICNIKCNKKSTTNIVYAILNAII